MNSAITVNQSLLFEMYAYAEIDSSKKEIRLLNLWPRTVKPKVDAGNHLHCSLETVSLLDNPTYHAISYTWGKSLNSKTILVNNQRVEVTENLESALRNIQNESTFLPVWIDAICINQKNNLEKSWQVNQMGDVYRQACYVVVWLGKDADNSDAVMDAISMIGSQGSRFVESTIDELETMAEKCAKCKPEDAKTFLKDSPELLYHRIIGTFGDGWKFPLLALKAFIQRSWWRRVWIMQELVLAKQPIFLCGAKTVTEQDVMGSWVAIELVQRTISRRIFNKGEEPSEYEKDFVSAIADDAVKKMLLYRRRINPLYKGAVSPSLYTLLQLTTLGRTGRENPNFDSTDPRDRVFGLLGLATDAQSLNIRPNYVEDCSKAYVRSTTALLKQGFTSVLDLNQFPKRLTGLPSWVPDWSCPLTQQLQQYKGGWDTAQVPVFQASRTTIPSLAVIKLDSVQPILQIEGMLVGTINASSQTWEEHWPNEEDGKDIIDVGLTWLEKLYNLCQHRRLLSSVFNRKLSGYPYGDDEDWRVAALIVSSSGQISDPKDGTPLRMTQEHALRIMQIIQDSKNQEKQPSKQNDVSLVYEYMMNISERAFRRRPFLTSDGLLGIGPHGLEKGDIVVIFMGANVPYILRKCKPQGYKLLGEAFIEGIMDGEHCNGTQTERFDLV
jgi:hypothetical protein